MKNLVFAAFVLGSAVTLGAAGPQPQHCHLAGDATPELIAASAFLHGLRHGYEAGFHEADRELHLARFEPATEPPEKLPKPGGYPPGMGSRESFRKGFERGFRLGYTDSMTASGFRLVSPGLEKLASKERDFDRGVQEGFDGAACGAGSTEAYCAGVKVGRAIAGTTTEVAALPK